MPPPSNSSTGRMSSNPNQSPMLCPSSTGYTISQTSTNVSTAPLQSSSIYQVKSPIISPASSSTPLSSTATATKIQIGGSMAPATINLPQPTQPVPTTLTSHPSSVMTSNPVQQVPVMQIIQTQSPTGTNRHQPVTMKPIQPKPQQILPKPAGIANQVAYGGGKPVTLAAQRAPSSVNIQTTGHQTNPLVIGQGQTLIPNSGMGCQGGAYLLNQILGMGQNQIIIPSGTGLPHNVQLVMRSQPSASNTVPASQSSTSLSSASAVNNAFLAAFHAQAANQQAYINQSKALASQGQTVVMQAGQTLRAATPPQLTNATLRPNVISGPHMMSQGQPPLVLQQIQGPITVIQALQGANVGVGSTGITLANPSSAAGISQLGGILQGAVASSMPQSIVLNNQPVITTSVAQFGSMGDAVNGAVGQQQTSSQQIMGQTQQQTQPRPQSLDLEELLKQTGIMPDDPPSSCSQPTPESAQMQMEAQQPIVTFAHLPQMTTSECLSMMNGPQTVMMGQDQFQVSNNQSTLVAHLQQPLVSSQLQSGQVKFSLGQDGSWIIQRPVLTQGTALTLNHGNQQTLQPQQVTFTMANLSNVSTCSTTTTATTASNVQPMQSVVFQSVDGASQMQTQNATIQQQQQQLAAAAAASAAASIIPLSLQGINLVSAAVTAPITASQQQVFSRCGTPGSSQVAVNVTGPNSMLSQNHPNSTTVTLGGNKMAQQSPVLVHSLGNREVETAQATLPALGQAGNNESSSPSPSCGVTSSTSLPIVTQHPQHQQPPSQQIAEKPTVLVAGCPVPGVKPIHKIQTIQLSTQGQEALQRIQSQLQIVLARKPRTNQDWQQIQMLQSEQQKILSQGKVLSVQTQPLVQQFQKPQAPTSLDQPRCLQPKTSSSPQLQAPTPVIVSSAHCTSSKLTPNGANIRATPARNAATFQVSSSSAVLQATPTSTVITSSQPPPHIKIGNQIYTLAPAQQQQQTNIIGHQIKPLTVDAQNQQQLFANQTKQGLILKIQQQSTIPTQSDNCGTNIQNLNFSTGVAQIQQINRVVKRPASTPASRSNLIHQKLAADHNAVLCPDHKTPFNSKDDAIRRLLPYHVLVGRTMNTQDLEKADEMYDSVSEQILDKMQGLFDKYRYLILKESMKMNSTAEEVMLDKMFIQEETAALERDKQSVKEGKELDLPPPHWMDVVKTEPSYKSVENECGNIALINGEPVHVKQEPIDEPIVNSRGKRKHYDEWAEIQKELEMYPMGGDDISGSSEPVEFEPPSGGTSPVVDFEPPFPKIPKHEMISFKEGCQVNHIQRNHMENYQPASYYNQSHSLTMRSETSHWGVSESCRRISHPSDKCNEDENAVLGLEDIAGLGVGESVSNSSRLNHHHQSHEDEDSDSNDMTGLFAAAAAASVENNRSGSVDDDSQDDELSAQVQCAINSILNLQRIDDSCDAYPIPMVEDDYTCVTESGNSAVVTSGGKKLLGDGELEDNDEGNNKNKCSYFGFKREEETVREVEDGSAVEQQTVNFEASNVVVQHPAVQHNIVSYAMDGPSDIDIALDEAVKSILL
ncbi:glioma tumor suppressor candidate region protein 1 [Chamberlinius hualienensis]